MLVCGAYLTWPKQLKPWWVPNVPGSIMVVGALTRCALLHNLCELKIILYEFKLGGSNLKYFWVKNNGAVDQSTVTRWFKKFYSGCKNLDDQERSGKSKIVDSGAMLQAIEANQVSCTESIRRARHSTNQCGSSPSWFWQSIRNCRIVSHVTKILQKFCNFFLLA